MCFKRNVITWYFRIVYATSIWCLWNNYVSHSDLVKLNFDGLPLLIVVGLGVLAGVLLSSRIIKYFLHHHFYTFALITRVPISYIFPGLPQTGIEWTLSIITLIIGFD